MNIIRAMSVRRPGGSFSSWENLLWLILIGACAVVPLQMLFSFPK